MFGVAEEINKAMAERWIEAVMPPELHAKADLLEVRLMVWVGVNSVKFRPKFVAVRNLNDPYTYLVHHRRDGMIVTAVFSKFEDALRAVTDDKYFFQK
jgi:hypothetical protein